MKFQDTENKPQGHDFTMDPYPTSSANVHFRISSVAISGILLPNKAIYTRIAITRYFSA